LIRLRCCLWIGLGLACGAVSSAMAAPPAGFLTGNAFRKAIEQPISASWDNVDLRAIAQGIEATKHVSIVLDRRLDPTASRSAHAVDEPLKAFLERLAAESNALPSFIGNTAYLGPPETAGKLRTLAALRSQELFDKTAAIPEFRRIELTRGISLHWDDLDRPRDIVERLAGEYALSVEGLERLPHDLWAAALLPEASLAEALSVALAQFDLTFGWVGHGRGVRIEDIPARVTIDRPHDAIRGLSASASLARWKEAIPDLDARAETGKVIVTGTIEMHERVEHVRRGGRVAENPAGKAAPKLKPLKLQRYTGTIKNIPASALLKDLAAPEKGQLTFEYDPAELKAAGIELDKLVTLELKNATIEELLKSALGPLGVAFEIDDRTVRLKPANPKIDNSP